METLRRNIFLTVYKIKPPLLQWKKLNDLLKAVGYWLVSYWSAPFSLGEFTSLTPILHRPGRVALEALLGLNALVLSLAANKRLYVGLILIGVVAPLSGVSYMLFDRTVMVEGWYYVNNFYLFLVLGPSITQVCLLLGVYHLFPRKSKRAFLLTIPMGFSVGKIIWLITVTSNEELHSLTPANIILVGGLVSFVVMFSIEWFAWRNEHRFRAFCSRTDSLYNVVNEPSISDAKFRGMFKTVYQQKKNFPKEY